MSDKKQGVKKPSEKALRPEASFLFHKENYMLMGAGLLVLIIGFYLMSGTDDIFSTTKLTVAPIVVIIGFIIEFVAIIRKPKN